MKKNAHPIPPLIDLEAERLMEPKEVARLLGLSETAATKRMAREIIPGCFKIGAKGWRVSVGDFLRYVEHLKAQHRGETMIGEIIRVRPGHL